MAQAIQDDRAATCTANPGPGDGLEPATRCRGGRHARRVGPLTTPTQTPSRTHLTCPPDWPSYPVIVNPVGFNSYLPPYTQWIAGLNVKLQYGIRPTTVSYVATSLTPPWTVLQSFCNMDEINFDINGTPKLPQGAVLPAAFIERNFSPTRGCTCPFHGHRKETPRSWRCP